MTQVPPPNGNAPQHVQVVPTPVSIEMAKTQTPTGEWVIVFTMFTVLGPITTVWPTEGMAEMVRMGQQLVSGLTITDKLPRHPG